MLKQTWMHPTMTEAESIEKPTENLLAWLWRDALRDQVTPYRTVAVKRRYNTGSAIFRGVQTPYRISLSEAWAKGWREAPRTMTVHDSRVAGLGETMPPCMSLLRSPVEHRALIVSGP
ncbi:hypothetical protein VTN02DRAFT_99 [Thermoascus thermophilus]